MLHATVTRQASVSGLFYPGDRKELVEMVRGFLDAPAVVTEVPKALIAPHAGFLYSGPVAGTAFAQLQPARALITRVVLVGPTHRIPFQGIALSSARTFSTPLGAVPVDQEAVSAIAGLPEVLLLDAAHAEEHSLETHLPFLQLALDDAAIVPLVVGDASPQALATVFDTLWGGPETLLCVSSDLSHYHDYDTARRMDRATSDAIEALDPEAMTFDGACGRLPIQGLLLSAKRHHLQARTLDLRNSGDTAGPRGEVVGYGAYAFYPRPG